MSFNYLNLITIISENKGLGINTDIFETNVLNLSVVIGVLIYYGKVAFLIWNRLLVFKLFTY